MYQCMNSALETAILNFFFFVQGKRKDRERASKKDIGFGQNGDHLLGAS